MAMRVAIIGAGISGLVVAHLLHGEHQITVFEAADYAGGHTNTVRVDTAHETHHVDTGFIVFNDRNYHSFERLLSRLGVDWQPSEMSFSVSDETGEFEYSSRSPNGLFATRTHLLEPSFHRMVAELPRFQRACRRLLRDEAEGVSLGEWLERQRFSRAFIERLIVPQAAAVWSADPRQMWSFPARFLAEFFSNHGMLSLRGRPRWRVVRGGSARYVEALTRPFLERIRLRSPVEVITRDRDHVTVTARGCEPERFDEVVIATHSDQALALLGDASTTEREILGAIPYQPNEAVLHTDVRMLPRRQRAWASWNYHLLAAPPPAAAVTYDMNRLQSLSSEQRFCVTLNRTAAIDPAKVIRTIAYAHPVYTPAGIDAQQRVQEISGPNRTHFCGAYWGWGFHEDGVLSGVRVARRFGGTL
jgi:predicted NAD/FAD-binding protein